MSFIENDLKLEQKYLDSYPVDHVPDGALFLGTIENLACTLEIYEDTDGTYLSKVQDK